MVELESNHDPDKIKVVIKFGDFDPQKPSRYFACSRSLDWYFNDYKCMTTEND